MTRRAVFNDSGTLDDGSPVTISADAADIAVADTGGHFTATDVEAALAELATGGGGGGPVAAADVTVADTGSYYTGTDVEAVLAEIGAGGIGGGSPTAADVSVVDTGGHFTGTDVEAVLAELYSVASAAGGGGMTKLYDNTVTGSPAASIDTGAGGIASGYDTIIIEIIGRSSGAGAIDCIFNNDTGSNYDRQKLGVNNTTVSGSTSLAQAALNLPFHASGGSTNHQSYTKITIPSYDITTTFYKTMHVQSGYNDSTAGTNDWEIFQAAWRSTAAISRFKFNAVSGANLAVGTRIVIWGTGGAGAAVAASTVTVADTGGNFTGSNVETVLAELSDDIAAITGGGGATTHMRDASEWSFVGDNSTNNTPMWASMIADIAAGGTATTVVFAPGVYKFSTAIDALPSGVDFLRIIGAGGPPIFNQTASGEGDKIVVFNYANASSSTFIDMAVGSTIQSGVYFEYVNFVNTGNAANICVDIDQLNNWRFNYCGFQDWGVACKSHSNDDNAHGKFLDCLMNIPAGKVGHWIVGKTGSIGGSGGGYSIDGGNITGSTGSVAIQIDEFGAAVTTDGDVKIDGCTGGAVVCAGSLSILKGLRLERCSDATHASIQFKTGSAPVSGNGNQVICPVMTGGGASGEVPFSAESGAEGNLILGGVYQNFDSTVVGSVIAGKFGSYYGLDEVLIGSYSGALVGFYGSTGTAKQTGVAVSAAGIHAALVNLGLISA